jgi:hypothetical protein
MAGNGNDVSMSAPRVPERLFYAPAPDRAPPVTPNGYMLVGYGQVPEVPWPGQVEYRLVRARSDLRPHPDYDGMEEGVAVYEVRPAQR